MANTITGTIQRKGAALMAELKAELDRVRDDYIKIMNAVALGALKNGADEAEAKRLVRIVEADAMRATYAVSDAFEARIDREL
jgi:hypothetical protein